MQHSKTSVRKLIGEGMLKEAVSAATAYAEQCGLDSLLNDLSALSARLEDHRQQWSKGLLSYEDYSRTQAQITQGLLDTVGRLPDVPTPPAKGKKPLTEEAFKKRIFRRVCLCKVLVLLYLYYHWSTGGFNMDQFQSVAGLLIPAWAAYVTVIVGDYLRQQREGEPPVRYVSGPLVSFANWIFPLYALGHIIFITLKVKGSISYTQMNFFLVLAEGVLGGYVGQLVHGFFKKEG